MLHYPRPGKQKRPHPVEGASCLPLARPGEISYNLDEKRPYRGEKRTDEQMEKAPARAADGGGSAAEPRGGIGAGGEQRLSLAARLCRRAADGARLYEGRRGLSVSGGYLCLPRPRDRGELRAPLAAHGDPRAESGLRRGERLPLPERQRALPVQRERLPLHGRAQLFPAAGDRKDVQRARHALRGRRPAGPGAAGGRAPAGLGPLLPGHLRCGQCALALPHHQRRVARPALRRHDRRGQRCAQPCGERHVPGHDL